MKTQNIVTPIKITKSQMIELFRSVNRPMFISLTTETVVNMVVKDRDTKEKNPYHNQVTKHLKGNFLIGFDYEKRVKKNMELEGFDPTNFVVKSNWFQHETKTVVEKKSDTTFKYLMYEYFRGSRPKVHYTFGEQTIDKVLFEKFLTVKSEPTNQPQDKKVLPQTYSMDSIRGFSHNGNKYVVEQ